jgi:hypothetical protein
VGTPARSILRRAARTTCEARPGLCVVRAEARAAPRPVLGRGGTTINCMLLCLNTTIFSFLKGEVYMKNKRRLIASVLLGIISLVLIFNNISIVNGNSEGYSIYLPLILKN